MTHKYEIDLFWSEEDQAFLAEVPDLPGCTAHGSTHEEALAQIQDAITGWLEIARDSPPRSSPR